MQVTMQHAERLTLAEMREFLSASNNLSFAGTGRQQIYGLVEGVLRAQKYLELSKKDKGIVHRYLVKISGLSKAQITRLIARWRERGVIEPLALRRTRAYREHHVHHTKTRASAVSIGERRKPEPRGQPGYLRVDAVHQGDSGSGKGIYHINAVDTVTQWQIVGCCETISEAHLLPVL